MVLGVLGIYKIIDHPEIVNAINPIYAWQMFQTNGWFAVVLLALVINYFGQGAMLLQNPENIRSPFFLMAPNWALIPLVLLATFSTVIASQALITGVFSITMLDKFRPH